MLLLLEATQTGWQSRTAEKPTGQLLSNAAVLNAKAAEAARQGEEEGLERTYGKRSLELSRQAKAAGGKSGPEKK